MKIFEIGLMKTGTTSLIKAYKILGYRYKGWSPDINFEFNKSYDYEVLFKVIDRYDAFADGPWNGNDFPEDKLKGCDYKILDEKYTGSKFILLERDDESWIKSHEHWGSPVFNETMKRDDIDKRWVTDRDNLIKEKLDWKHLKYRGIKEYFKNRPNDLLVMNICDGERWEVLCPFLNKLIPDVLFPKENVTVYDQ